ncbi:hypothetical protein Tco_0205326 [Tanacetum coccineum]
MLKDSIDNGPYQFKPEITVKYTDGVTNIRRPQRLEDLAGEDKLRYESDIKAVNILLLKVPVDIYTLINHYQTAKEIWDRIKELLEGTKMNKQERKSMLYDEFDKFTFEPGESIHSYYLRYAKLINDMNIVASDDLRDALFVIHLIFAHSRFIHVRFGNESGVYNTEGSSPFMRVYQLNDPPRAIVTSTLSCLWMPRTIREAALQSSPSSDNSPIPEADQDDKDDDMDIEADDEEEEEEHLAPTDSVVVALPATDQAPSAEEIEPFETDESVATPPPHPAYHVTARISILAPYLHQYGLMQSFQTSR